MGYVNGAGRIGNGLFLFIFSLISCAGRRMNKVGFYGK
jgi:hypothetical protein